MSKISKVLVIGSGPIIIGQAAESVCLVGELAGAFDFTEEGKLTMQREALASPVKGDRNGRGSPSNLC